MENIVIETGQIWQCQGSGVQYQVIGADGDAATGRIYFVLGWLEIEAEPIRATFEFILEHFDQVKVD